MHFTLHLGFQIQEETLAAEILDKVITASAGIASYRGVLAADSAVDDLVERSVSAAGIEAELFLRFIATAAHFACGIAWTGGDINFNGITDLQRIQLCAQCFCDILGVCDLDA